MSRFTYVLILIAGFTIAGCDKEDPIPTRFTQIPAGNTNVKFLMMSPDAPSVNFLANGLKATSVTPSATNAVLGMTFPTIYPATIGYASFPSGAIKIEAKVPDSSIVMPGQVVFTNTPTFEANKFYTYALLDSLNKISAVLVEDDPSVPDAAYSYFRIVNFVSNTPNVKIEVLKTSSGVAYSKAFLNVAYKSVSAFDTLGAGSGQTYRVYLRNTTTNAILDSIAAFVPTNTKKYTIYTRGVFGQSGGTNTRRPIITNYTSF